MPKINKKVKILVVSANPETTRPLRLEQEKRDIEDALIASPLRDFFEIDTLHAARLSDLRRKLVDPKSTPNILHFCGHGSGAKGLVFEDHDGKAKHVQGESLANFLSLFSDSLMCVVLNACYSEAQANEIKEHVDCVIGMEERIGDKSAIAFAVAFYEALFAGRPYQFAYDYACSAIKLDGDLSALKPKFLLREAASNYPLSLHDVADDTADTEQKRNEQPTVSMVQNGRNGLQIGSISGGTLTINRG